ncbi:MAG: transcription termination/antitermination protein NusA [Candidatus Omnitrophica bacterium]|nr:transcription termination/antitermination protein NusA [Candidatus Omnitrophota bacterium]
MSKELLAILEQIEREKGIKKEVLINAVETAMVSAIRKTLNLESSHDIQVVINPNNGEIQATYEGKKITDLDFGRIAAQTAKQVIIQKIREAEKENIFIEFQDRVGEIVSGTVYRFERNSIIIDLLGKGEGILPRRHQCPNETFRQGERIRTYVLEVSKQVRGAQIILSRSHSNFVKKIFELEVPEIYEGIVEIRAIARQPGERTKITVYSKDERVDSVGACVGMRGSRVKNVVNELRGEKIDIVRYSENMKDYIIAALSPAQIIEVCLDKANQRAEVIVNRDQLSLAIGRNGQNVRLASRLVGWELDIRSPEDVEKQRLKEAPPKDDLINLSGVGEKLLENLNAAGFKSVIDLAGAAIDDLCKVKGMGQKKAKKLISEAKKTIPLNEKDKKT